MELKKKEEWHIYPNDKGRFETKSGFVIEFRWSEDKTHMIVEFDHELGLEMLRAY